MSTVIRHVIKYEIYNYDKHRSKKRKIDWSKVTP